MKTAIESVLSVFDRLPERVDRSIVITIASRYLNDNKDQIISAHAAGQLIGMQEGRTNSNADVDYFNNNYDARPITI